VISLTEKILETKIKMAANFAQIARKLCGEIKKAMTD
jgi:hypothetical protein